MHVKYPLKHAIRCFTRKDTHSKTPAIQGGHHTHTYTVYLIHSHDAETGASVRQTHSHWGGRNLQAAAMERVAMATASLRLVSASPRSPSLSLSLHEPLSRGQSLIDCCRGNILLLCISNPVAPFATSLPESHFISGK